VGEGLYEAALAQQVPITLMYWLLLFEYDLKYQPSSHCSTQLAR
jgi:hypothetical protein